MARHLLEADDAAAIRLVSERSEGNPFYAGELARSYLEVGSLERLPDTVHSTVLARLDMVPAGERRLLQVASIFGRIFRASTAGALDAIAETDARSICDQLAERDLIAPAADDRYAFRHMLIQEVVYSTLPRAERARLHAEAAHLLEPESAEREASLAETVAFHYREAALEYAALEPHSAVALKARGEAAKWLLKAADAAEAAGAVAEAVRHVRAAMDFIDSELKPALLERVGRLSVGDAAVKAYRQALDLYESQGASADDRLRALGGILTVALRQENTIEENMSLEAMNELRAYGRQLFGQAQDARTRGLFLAADAFYPNWQRTLAFREPATPVLSAEELALAEASARGAVEIGEQTGDPEVASAGWDGLGYAALTTFDWPKAIAAQRRRLEIKGLSLYERLDACLYSGAAYSLYDLGLAERASAQAMALLLPGHFPARALNVFGFRILSLFLLGRWDEAVTVFYRALEAWSDAGRLCTPYALKGLLPALDIGRARVNQQLVEDASAIILSIVEGRDYLGVKLHVEGRPAFSKDDPVRRLRYPGDLLERRLSLAADLRTAIPADLLRELFARSVTQNIPLLTAQIRRCIGLANGDARELAAAIPIWEAAGCLPNLGRAKAELGRLTGDTADREAGLSILKGLKDVKYVEHFAETS